jgi:hypothetical protein
MKRKWFILLVALVTIALLSGVGWFVVRPRDPLFHGKPESEWIKGIAYGMSLTDDQNREQIDRWRSFGPEGLDVLGRGLVNPGRTYRTVYRRLSPRLPQILLRFLPDPKMDTTRSARMCVLDLLGRMGRDARPAWPAVARALEDEDASVRQIAINFFTSSEDKNALLNQIPAREKKRLLPLFLRAAEDGGNNWGLRNNALIALRYYPEDASLVAPTLVKALQDPAPYVRIMAADALHRVDADAGKKAGAVDVLIKLTSDQDDQIASRAVSTLREFKNGPDAVPALIQAMHGTNVNVGCNAVWALQFDFPDFADKIIPEMRKAAERKDNVGGYARSALKSLESKPAR